MSLYTQSCMFTRVYTVYTQSHVMNIQCRSIHSHVCLRASIHRVMNIQCRCCVCICHAMAQRDQYTYIHLRMCACMNLCVYMHTNTTCQCTCYAVASTTGGKTSKPWTHTCMHTHILACIHADHFDQHNRRKCIQTMDYFYTNFAGKDGFV